MTHNSHVPKVKKLGCAKLFASYTIKEAFFNIVDIIEK